MHSRPFAAANPDMAAAALPDESTITRSTPIVLRYASRTAAPRSLNEPVGRSESSLNRTCRPASVPGTSGVMPAPSVAAPSRAIGNAAAYRQMDASSRTIWSGSTVGSQSSSSAPPHDGQRQIDCSSGSTCPQRSQRNCDFTIVEPSLPNRHRSAECSSRFGQPLCR